MLEGSAFAVSTSMAVQTSGCRRRQFGFDRAGGVVCPHLLVARFLRFVIGAKMIDYGLQVASLTIGALDARFHAGPSLRYAGITGGSKGGCVRTQGSRGWRSLVEAVTRRRQWTVHTADRPPRPGGRIGRRLATQGSTAGQIADVAIQPADRHALQRSAVPDGCGDARRAMAPALQTELPRCGRACCCSVASS